jgi:prepilin-type processing-associated H-X9-DG protein
VRPRVILVDNFVCPSAEPQPNDDSTEKNANYSAVAGPGRNGERIVLPDEICGNVHTDGLYYPGSDTPISRIIDGTSNTLAVGERNYMFRNWLYGADWYGDPVESMCSGAAQNVLYPINANQYQFGFYKFDPLAPTDELRKMPLNDLQFGSDHPGGANFSYADGSVHFLPDDVDFTAYQNMATKDGGEVTQPVD